MLNAYSMRCASWKVVSAGKWKTLAKSTASFMGSSPLCSATLPLRPTAMFTSRYIINGYFPLQEVVVSGRLRNVKPSGFVLLSCTLRLSSNRCAQNVSFSVRYSRPFFSRSTIERAPGTTTDSRRRLRGERLDWYYVFAAVVTAPYLRPLYSQEKGWKYSSYF